MAKLTCWLAVLISAALLTGRGAGAEERGEALVGTGAPVFALATSEGRLADYTADYYGKHHLILTFFPAAFTPV